MKQADLPDMHLITKYHSRIQFLLCDFGKYSKYV